MRIQDVEKIPFSDGTTIGQMKDLIDNGDVIVLGKQYSSRDYVIETRQEEDSQSFIVRKRRV